jgi:hypothetical protein
MSSPLPLSAKQPPQVFWALIFLGVGLFLAPVRAALRANWDSPFSSMIVVLLLLALAVLWVSGLYRRKRWLWWFTVISLAIGVIATPWDVARQGTGFQLTLYYAQCATAASAVGLLCLAPARRWFHVSAA